MGKKRRIKNVESVSCTPIPRTKAKGVRMRCIVWQKDQPTPEEIEAFAVESDEVPDFFATGDSFGIGEVDSGKTFDVEIEETTKSRKFLRLVKKKKPRKKKGKKKSKK